MNHTQKTEKQNKKSTEFPSFYIGDIGDIGDILSEVMRINISFLSFIYPFVQLFIHPFIHLLNRHLLNAYHYPGTTYAQGIQQ